jgi:hypothetical protein
MQRVMTPTASCSGTGTPSCRRRCRRRCCCGCCFCEAVAKLSYPDFRQVLSEIVSAPAAFMTTPRPSPPPSPSPSPPLPQQSSPPPLDRPHPLPSISSPSSLLNRHRRSAAPPIRCPASICSLTGLRFDIYLAFGSGIDLNRRHHLHASRETKQ